MSPFKEQTQCSVCALVQFRTKKNECRRCRTRLPEPQTEAAHPLTSGRPLQEPAGGNPPRGLIQPLQETIRLAVLDALDKCQGNVVLAAKYLGMGKTTLYRYLRKWGRASSCKQPVALISGQNENRPNI
jgi:transcriptional regulator of acetoin/glycerol metabolism